MISFQDRVRGVVISTALGDAIGAPVEKMSYREIKQKYHRVESLNTEWYKANESEEVRLGRMRGNGIVTDDTLMTVALMNVYKQERRHLDAYDMGNGLVKEIVHRKTFIPELSKEASII